MIALGDKRAEQEKWEKIELNEMLIIIGSYEDHPDRRDQQREQRVPRRASKAYSNDLVDPNPWCFSRRGASFPLLLVYQTVTMQSVEHSLSGTMIQTGNHFDLMGVLKR